MTLLPILRKLKQSENFHTLPPPHELPSSVSVLAIFLVFILDELFYVLLCAFVLDPSFLLYHLLKELLQLLSFHINFFLYWIISVSKQTSYYFCHLKKIDPLFTTCFPIFLVSFCPIIPRKSCLNLLLPRFLLPYSVKPTPIRPVHHSC